jgi:integrase
MSTDLRLRPTDAGAMPVTATKLAEAANRLRGRIELILNWAKAMGHYSQENPARWKGHLSNLLPKKSRIARTKHFTALPYGEIPQFMARLRACEGIGAKALEFTFLTACRSSEVTKARWSEFNLRDKVWTIPAERMKAGKEHTVPLTEAAIRILREVEPLSDDFVFPSPRTREEISDATMRAVLKRMGFPDLTVHGFRSTFRDWASETTSHAHQVCEMALAHTIENRAEAACRRGDLKDKRRLLMNDWAAFLYVSVQEYQGASAGSDRSQLIA